MSGFLAAWLDFASVLYLTAMTFLLSLKAPLRSEQYVCQQLKTIEDLDVYYYTNDRGSCEIDFVVDTGERIVPVEVKAEVNLRAKSLKNISGKIFT